MGQMPNFTAKNMAVFIDADNLSNATALDHVFADLQSRAERISYRRAYGRPESLKTIEAVLWRHGVRPVTNLVTNKVTTDIALTIDVVEAVCQREIDAVAICSGDADFAPLAIWLREQGCRVFCFSLSNTIFANPESFYDDVVLLEVVDPVDPPKPMLEPVPPVAPAPALITPVPAPVPASAPVPTPAPAPLQVDMVQQVLQAFPALRGGEPQHLSQVVAKLRLCGILDKNTKTTTWFARCAPEFELLPKPVPNQIRYQKRKKPSPPVLSSSVKVAPIKYQAIAPVPAPAILSWPVLAPRRPAPPLLVELHGLRSVLTQLALCRVTVADVLLAVPELIHGQVCSFSAVAGRLRQRGLLRSCDSALRILERFPNSFAVAPETNPQAVIYLC